MIGVHANLLSLAPGIPPSNLNSTSLDAFSVKLQWNGIDRSSMNGFPSGYIVFVYINVTIIFKFTVDFSQHYLFVENLIPETSYIFEVCAYNQAGKGPCERTATTTKASGML